MLKLMKYKLKLMKYKRKRDSDDNHKLCIYSIYIVFISLILSLIDFLEAYYALVNSESTYETNLLFPNFRSRYMIYLGIIIGFFIFKVVILFLINNYNEIVGTRDHMNERERSKLLKLFLIINFIPIIISFICIVNNTIIIITI